MAKLKTLDAGVEFTDGGNVVKVGPKTEFECSDDAAERVIKSGAAVRVADKPKDSKK